MDLPDNIKNDVLKYLHLEFGESESDPEGLKIEDLNYEGVQKIDGHSLWCWSFPSLSNDTWATVELSGKTYSIGMVSIPNTNKELTYDYLWVEFWEGKSQVVKIPLTHNNDSSITHTEDDYIHELSSGEELVISIEILRWKSPCEYTVHISHNKVSVSFHGEVKGVIDYNIYEKTGVKVIVGGEKWL